MFFRLAFCSAGDQLPLQNPDDDFSTPEIHLMHETLVQVVQCALCLTAMKRQSWPRNLQVDRWGTCKHVTRTLVYKSTELWHTMTSTEFGCWCIHTPDVTVNQREDDALSIPAGADRKDFTFHPRWPFNKYSLKITRTYTTQSIFFVTTFSDVYCLLVMEQTTL